MGTTAISRSKTYVRIFSDGLDFLAVEFVDKSDHLWHIIDHHGIRNILLFLIRQSLCPVGLVR